MDPTALPAIITGLVGSLSAYMTYKVGLAQAKQTGAAEPAKPAEASTALAALPVVEQAIAQHGTPDEQADFVSFQRNPQRYSEPFKQTLADLLQREPALADQLARLLPSAAGGVTVAGDGSVGIGGAVMNSPIMTGNNNQVGDRSDARGAQGYINKPTAPVTQHFGDQRNVTTGGGDYAAGNIDKRSGAFVSGGTVYGAVVGTNSGTMNSHYGSPGSAGSDPLGQVIALTEQLIVTTKQRSATTLAEDLQEVLTVLQAAQRAIGDPARRTQKLQAARAALAGLVAANPEVQPLLNQLQGVS